MPSPRNFRVAVLSFCNSSRTPSNTSETTFERLRGSSASSSAISPAFTSWLCDANLPEWTYFNRSGSTFRRELRTFQSKERVDSERIEFCWTLRYDGCGITLQVRVFARVSGTWEQQMPARPTSGGCAARKSPMWTGSWLAYGEILRNSADRAARCLNRATTRPDVVRTRLRAKRLRHRLRGKGVTTGTMSRALQGVRAERYDDDGELKGRWSTITYPASASAVPKCGSLPVG